MVAFSFSYLGITFFSAVITHDWSWDLIGVLCGATIFGRFISIFGIIGILRIFGYKAGISCKQLFFISYAGCVRGVIAFGLILRITNQEQVHRSVIVTACQTLVVFTTVGLV